MPRLAPDFQHHGAKRIAGQRVGGGPQRGVDIHRAHRHEATRIEAEFGQPTHRDRARFNFGEILTDPKQRPPCRHPSREPCNESRRRGTLPAFGEDLMHRGSGKTALQHHVCIRMAERHAIGRHTARMRLEAFDAPTQIRKRVRARAGHAPLPSNVGPSLVFPEGEPAAGSFVHDMF